MHMKHFFSEDTSLNYPNKPLMLSTSLI